jgi:hypothetical protein
LKSSAAIAISAPFWVFMFSGVLNITKLYAEAVPRWLKRRNTFSDNVLHAYWPVSAGVRKLKDPKNRAPSVQLPVSPFPHRIPYEFSRVRKYVCHFQHHVRRASPCV